MPIQIEVPELGESVASATPGRTRPESPGVTIEPEAPLALL